MPSAPAKRELGMQLFAILCILIPLIILFLLPGGGLMVGAMYFWMGLLLCFWLISVLFGTRMETVPVESSRLLAASEQPAIVTESMDVRFAEEENGIRLFRGRLLEPAAEVYANLKRTLGSEFVPMVQSDEKFGASIVLVPEPIEKAVVEQHDRPWINGLLFALTVGTTTWAGAAHQGVNLLLEPSRFAVGLPYALGLLLILDVVTARSVRLARADDVGDHRIFYCRQRCPATGRCNSARSAAALVRLRGFCHRRAHSCTTAAFAVECRWFHCPYM